MACECYNDNGYKCGGCCNFTRSTSIAVSGDNVVITIPSETVRNHRRVCICLAQNIPEGATADTPVVVEITGVTGTFPLFTKCGNSVYGDQLRSRKVLHTMALTDVPAFKVLDKKGLCPTYHVFPTLTPTPTPAPTA